MQRMTHNQVVRFLQTLVSDCYIKHSTDVVASCGISDAAMDSYLKDPAKRGARLIPIDDLVELIAAVQEWTHGHRWEKAIAWNIERGNGYYEAVDADGEHILYQTVYAKALEIADKRLGSVRIHANASDLSQLDCPQSLRSRWRRALHSSTLDLEEVCAVTGYDAYLVVCLGSEDIELNHITGNPSDTAVQALEALVAKQERMAA